MVLKCESCKRALQKGDKAIKSTDGLYFCPYSPCRANYVFNMGKPVIGEVITL
jgi:hypothetical protein